VPPDAARGYDAAGEEDVLWVSPADAESRALSAPARDFDDAVVDWIEAHARRSFDVLFDDDLRIEFIRGLASVPGARTRLRRLTQRQLRRVVVELVEEGVPFGTRREALLDALAGFTTGPVQPELLTEKVREHLRTDICRSVSDQAGQVTTLLLDAGLEQALADLVRVGDDRTVLAIEPVYAKRVADAVRRSVERLLKEQVPPPIVVTPPHLRYCLARLLRRFDQRITVLSFTELGPDVITIPGGLVGSAELVPSPA
jgi:hypothetical protein